jgi:hypothetical protein
MRLLWVLVGRLASRIAVTIVTRTDKEAKTFVVLPKRWVVERTFGWINHARRLAKDFEATAKSSLAWLLLALAFLLMRRLGRLDDGSLEFRVGLSDGYRGLPMSASRTRVLVALGE